jgi:hypothetical protein
MALARKVLLRSLVVVEEGVGAAKDSSSGMRRSQACAWKRTRICTQPGLISELSPKFSELSLKHAEQEAELSEGAPAIPQLLWESTLIFLA